MGGDSSKLGGGDWLKKFRENLSFREKFRGHRNTHQKCFHHSEQERVDERTISFRLLFARETLMASRHGELSVALGTSLLDLTI
jgi:hypothetical protein